MQDVFLITGASKGLGRSLALSIADSGCIVIALARESPELKSVEVELKKISEQSIAIVCELSIPCSSIQSRALFENIVSLV